MRGVLAAYLVVAAGAAVVAPSLFWVVLAGAGVVAAAVLAFRHVVGVSAAWLLVVGCTLEMSLGDLLGPGAYQPIIGMVKAVGLVLAGMAIVRFGPRADLFNPGLAFVAMFVVGWVHGLHPELTLGDSLRSLVGSVAPFAFSFSRLSRDWSRAIIGVTLGPGVQRGDRRRCWRGRGAAAVFVDWAERGWRRSAIRRSWPGLRWRESMPA